ncbi:pimeloyl-ACP methyl ester carboxylesterase [Actinoplanes octamycinicus]|uniref:Pimeloyl-ACP methyl ester carboxylesterase n=1 Tax=Actinoplanes octamycinicus TaxID=135948 RepID=A0A7W7H1Q7_9ACTN|nr:epoxide hydrolase family protein [Actinoplanes octamycinicus]MBB4742298.1 pimeloyl-ACP methyl ester carboxylesterase [Actinoplanes octamycinicus]GIE59857.1 hydrolase [Actinoplanes octamycinicus]
MPTTDASGPTRRTVLRGGLAAGVAVATTATVTGALGSTAAGATTTSAAARIRPFRVEIPTSRLTELSHRVGSTRWPARELVADRSQGVQLATAQAVAKYWRTRYDWRRFEAKINALPQFTTEIDGLDIHFLHIRSPHRDALPLLVTHGWPGSIVEFLDAAGPLTDPTRFGGRASDAFHLVIPSIPGYGFSGRPTETGWGAARVATAWIELMNRLGYPRWVAQGGDVGAAVTDTLGRLAPAGLAGIHLNLLLAALAGVPFPAGTDEEKTATAALTAFQRTGSAYISEQSTRPETIGYALSDSPAALAAWMLDHDTDSYTKISKAFLGGAPAGNLTRDHVLDNISLYWLTNTGVSATRIYWESAQPQPGAGGTLPEIKVPVGFSAFPGEIFQAPRSWVAAAYPTLNYYNQPARGGHFAAWEEPELFAAELRAAFRTAR